MSYLDQLRENYITKSKVVNSITEEILRLQQDVKVTAGEEKKRLNEELMLARNRLAEAKIEQEMAKREVAEREAEMAENQAIEQQREREAKKTQKNRAIGKINVHLRQVLPSKTCDEIVKYLKECDLSLEISELILATNDAQLSMDITDGIFIGKYFALDIEAMKFLQDRIGRFIQSDTN